MNSKVHDYIEIFNKAKGDSLEKVKHILMKYSENWDWAGSDSIIADLLDDKNITADDMLEFLQGSVELEEGNREFKAAVTAIDISLKKLQKIHEAKVVKIEYFDDEAGSASDYHTHSSFSELAQAS